MSQKQQQQPLPAGLHIESGWSDEERLKELKKRKIKQQTDRKHNQGLLQNKLVTAYLIKK